MNRPERATLAAVRHRFELQRGRRTISPRIRRRIRGSEHEAVRELSPLVALARCVGIQPSYKDTAGKPQEAAPETLQALLRIWGIEAQNPRQCRAALREQEGTVWQRYFEPVIVAWDGKPPRVEVRIPKRQPEAIARCEIEFEDGGHVTIDVPAGHMRLLARAEAQGREYEIRQLDLPRLPHGYHRLQFEFGGRRDRALVISAPALTFTNADLNRAWGVFAPLYALHSRTSWGGGTLREWRGLSRWVHTLGGQVAGGLPLLAAFLRPPLFEPSPYSPASRLFWNEFYLDIPALPEFRRCRAAQWLVASKTFQEKLLHFNESKSVLYVEEAAVRRSVIELLVDCFFRSRTQRRARFEAFVRSRPQVVDYAEFAGAVEKAGTSWRKWEMRMFSGKLQEGDFSQAAKEYHLYCQWMAEEQMSELTGEARKQGLHFYLDLPLGAHPDGYDVWRHRNSFALNVHAGAPRDPYFTKGQDWGFEPLHPQRIRESGFGYVRDYLRFQMRQTGLLRIDHVMGLHRMYWIPPRFPASHGAYVTYPAEELHAILSLESHRHRTMLVGEDLGVVPPEVTAGMKAHGLRQMYVVQYEQQLDAKGGLRWPPRKAVASMNTHDMPTFAAYWRGQDIEQRFELGLLSADAVPQERRRRARLKNALIKFLQKEGRLNQVECDSPAVLRACLEWLSAAPPELVLINLEDLWDETEPQNVPGTVTEANWSRKTKLRLEALKRSESVLDVLRRVNMLRREVRAVKG